MQPISYKRHRFPPEVIRPAVWLYYRFALSVRDMEELMTERGVGQPKSAPNRGYEGRGAFGEEPAPAAASAAPPLARRRDDDQDRR